MLLLFVYFNVGFTGVVPTAGGERGEGRGSLYLTATLSHHQYHFRIKMGRDVSRLNGSFIAQGKVTRQRS